MAELGRENLRCTFHVTYEPCYNAFVYSCFPVAVRPTDFLPIDPFVFQSKLANPHITWVIPSKQPCLNGNFICCRSSAIVAKVSFNRCTLHGKTKKVYKPLKFDKMHPIKCTMCKRWPRETKTKVYG